MIQKKKKTWTIWQKQQKAAISSCHYRGEESRTGDKGGFNQALKSSGQVQSASWPWPGGCWDTRQPPSDTSPPFSNRIFARMEADLKASAARLGSGSCRSSQRRAGGCQSSRKRSLKKKRKKNQKCSCQPTMRCFSISLSNVTQPFLENQAVVYLLKIWILAIMETNWEKLCKLQTWNRQVTQDCETCADFLCWG